MSEILRRKAPCWYELQFRGRIRPSIRVRVREEWIRERPQIKRTALIEGMMTLYGLSGFYGNLESRYIGFYGGFLSNLGTRNGFVTLEAWVPQAVRFTRQLCEHCDGKGKKNREVCIFCKGKGKEYNPWPEKVQPICASLAALFTHLRFENGPSSCSVPQLLELDGLSIALQGSFGITLADWLRQQPLGRDIPSVIDAMRRVHQRLWAEQLLPYRRLRRHDFQASVHGQGGWFTTCMPGKGGVYPSSGGTGRAGEGYKFGDTGETPMSYLVGLAGLAALHELVRDQTT